MLRLKILKQLPRIKCTSSTKKATMLLNHWCKSDLLMGGSSYFLLEGLTCKNIFCSSHLAKYNRKSDSQDLYTDSDDEGDVEDFKDERDSKLIKTKVNSLRADLLLKAGLAIARNKVENIFYESRIRINAKKVSKKSVQLNEGDEIDVIRGFSQQNPSHLVISRVIILSASEREAGYIVTLRRYKNLLVENYSGANAFKSSSDLDH